MAFIAYGAGAAQVFPSVYQDPKYPKDIVINGVLFDIDTFTPRVGSRVMAYTGDQGTTSKAYTSYDDDDLYYFGIWQNDHTSGQYVNIVSPVYPYVSRDIKTDYSHYNATDGTQLTHYINGNTSLWHRDWLEHPLKVWHYNETIEEYLGMWAYFDHSGARAHYEGTGGLTLFQDGTYRTQGAEYGYNIIDPDTSSGMLYRHIHSSSTQTSHQLVVINYATNENLRTTTKTELYGSTTQPQYIHHLTKCNNGDHFFLAHEGSTTGNNRNVDLVRYDNSANTTTVENNNFATAGNAGYPMSIPSNVVYHQESDESTTSKKICYYYHAGGATFDATGTNALRLIEMDVDAATITLTTCTCTYPSIDNAEDDILVVNNSALGPRYLFETRILSASQEIDSQKYVMVFVQNNGFHSTDHDRTFMIVKVSASDATSISALTSTTTYGIWDDILTSSSKKVNDRDLCPWAVAPLNTEHTLMMVFTKHSTHVIKFDTSNETLSEVWMDDYSVFNEIMWMPSGKVLTVESDKTFQNGTTATDFHAPKPIQVWAQDLVYNVSITTDSDYVSYAGSDITNDLSISAQDGTDSNVETDLTLQIIGPAVFDNSAKTKTVTTSKTASVTETLTINDNGHIEVQVIEIQSQ